MTDIERVKQLTEILNQYRDEYYNLSRPSVSDEEYDALFDELKEMEKKTGFICSNSPTQTVGYTVNTSLLKVKHDHPLLSLAKTKDFSEAANFTGSEEALLMFKLDGLTVCLIYENGELIEASTRGNGEEGSLITDNARTFINIPKAIPFLGRLKIVGEGIIRRSDFDEINSVMPEGEKYKTPRNLASGSIQQLDSGICAQRRVRFYAFNVLEGIEEPFLSRRLEVAESFGFDICPFEILNNEKNFADRVDEMVRNADSMSIPIDGLVIMYNNIAYGYSLGRTGHHYRNGIALKFQEEEEETTLRDIEWQVGRTGKITPVAIFDTVILDGTNVSAASLHNISTIQKLGIKKNATVTVVKKNEIIPQIVKSVGGSNEFEYPSVCPVCGSPAIIKNDGVTITAWCENEDCVAKSIRSLTYFASKDCMNIDGLSEKTLQKFVDEGLIRNIYDIYTLKDHKREITSFEGMGEKMYESLISAIEKSRKVKLENFIAALGISNVALSKAKIISRYFNGQWSEFKKAVDDNFDFTTLDGFGAEINRYIHTFFRYKFDVKPEYKKLLDIIGFIIPENSNTNFSLAGKTFVITGSLNNFPSRKVLQDKIESMGGKVAGSVSKNTDYLINNDSTSSSTKNKKAQILNVPIITEEEFLNMINE